MGWEGAIDRLLLRQIDNVSRGRERPDEIRDAITELIDLAPERTRSYFHLGYAQVILDEHLIDRPLDSLDRAPKTWASFGRMIGLFRRRAHLAITEMLHQEDGLALLDEPAVAKAAASVVLRTAFEDGDLDLAIASIERLGADTRDSERESRRDAFKEALSEILRRVERSRDRADEETLKDLLVRCQQLPLFQEVTAEVRAPVHRSIGRIHQHFGEWDRAREEFEACLEISGEGHTLASVLHFDLAACHLRVRGVPDLRPDPSREGIEPALGHLDKATAEPKFASFNAYFARGVLRFEKEQYTEAASDFEHALEKIQNYRNPLPVTLARIRYYLGVCLICSGEGRNEERASRLIDQSLDRVEPTLDTMTLIHDKLKAIDQRIARRHLGAIDWEKNLSGAEIVRIGKESLGLGEPARALRAIDSVLESTTDLSTRVEALEIKLHCHNLIGDKSAAREAYYQLSDRLIENGDFQRLRHLLEDDSGPCVALDHVEVELELDRVMDLMEASPTDRAHVLAELGHLYRSRREPEATSIALRLLERAHELDPSDSSIEEDLAAIRITAEQSKVEALDDEWFGDLADRCRRLVGRDPSLLILGGSDVPRERFVSQRRELEGIQESFDLTLDWWPANTTEPREPITRLNDSLRNGDLDGLVLLDRNSQRVIKEMREVARGRRISARTFHYLGVESLRIGIAEVLAAIIKARTRASRDGSREDASS